MLIMITGSRDFIDRAFIKDVLNKYVAKNPIVIHGAQRGADRHAESVCKELGMRCIPFPADEGVPSPQRFHQRNDQMLYLDPDIVIAFKRTGYGNKGTQSVIEKAQLAGIPVQRFERP